MKHPLRRSAIPESFAIGLATESKVIRSVMDPQAIRPVWFHGIRLSTSVEDRKGYDAFATLDVGVVPMQIKTSQGAISGWRKTHPEKKDVVILSIPRHLTWDETRDKILLHLWRRRLEILQTFRKLRTG